MRGLARLLQANMYRAVSKILSLYDFRLSTDDIRDFGGAAVLGLDSYCRATRIERSVVIDGGLVRR
jgi:hypothetical protein